MAWTGAAGALTGSRCAHFPTLSGPDIVVLPAMQAQRGDLGALEVVGAPR